MPSARRPSYKRRPSAARGEPGSSDVISASKESPAIGAATAPAAPPAPDNVLSFPEPKSKRRRRIVQGTIAALAVLVAGILAAAVYSPVLALQSVTVEGTRLLTPGIGSSRAG